MLNTLRNLFANPITRPYGLFQIEPTLECSLTCIMCPWSDMRSNQPQFLVSDENSDGNPLTFARSRPVTDMTWETFERITTYMPLARDVDLTGGGEPLKQPRLAEMVRSASQAGCRVGFSTNAMLLSPQVADELLDAGLDWISFSVDAASVVLYEQIRQGASFDQVIGNIAGLHDLLRSRRPERKSGRRLKTMMVFVVMTGAQQNYHELPAFIELAHSLGVEQVIAKNLDVILKEGDDERRVFSHEDAPAQEVQVAIETARHRAAKLDVALRLYALQPREIPICEHDPLHNLFFNWEGYVSPCITQSYAAERYFAGQRIQAACLRFGNICTETLEQIWSKASYQEFRGCYTARAHAERQVFVDSLLGGSTQPGTIRPVELPPAPHSCRTCYYLYGI